MNICEPVEHAIAAVHERVAFIIDGEPVTFAAVGGAVDRAAGALRARGIGKGDHVALVEPTSVLSVATVLACARLGAAAAPMSARLTSGEIAGMAAAAGCIPLAVAGPEHAARVEEALGDRPLGEEILSHGGPVTEPAHVSDEDVAVVLFTSGTTGMPKPIPLRHGVLGPRIAGFSGTPTADAEQQLTLLCVPFHHVAGLVGVYVGLAGGNVSVLQRRFDAGEWLSLAERFGTTRSFLVPTMLQRILDHPSFASADLSAMRAIVYGAAPASPELVARAVAAMPQVDFLQVFGQTETLGAVTALGPDDHRAGRTGSVGKPMPGVDVRIVDPETGEEAPDGEAGEFWVRAAHTVVKGWVRTGDLVCRDADGYLYAVGRLNEVINRGGEKIDPVEVETVLRAHPSIADVAVFGFADADLGEKVGAAVVTSQVIDGDALQTWCRERMASFKVPQRIVFVDEIPLTEVGKVSRRALRALLDM